MRLRNVKSTGRVRLSILLLSLLVPLASLSAQQETGLVGTWRSQSSDTSLIITLNDDGTGKVGGASVKYSVRGNKLVVNDDGALNTYTFSLNGDILKVSGGDLDEPLILERQKRTGRSNGASAKSGSGLVGRWKSDQYTLQISDNGTVSINGESFRYRVQGNVITLSGNDGSLQIPFELNDDTLITTYNGQQTVYHRMSKNDEDAGESLGARPAELVGKWCYMSNVNANNGGRMSNRCFTLYENGTYQYYAETSSSGEYGSTASQESDSGTWSATESTITAHSLKYGTLTYTLEKRNHPKTGDPMLVLGGDAYVTYTQRQPW